MTTSFRRTFLGVYARGFASTIADEIQKHNEYNARFNRCEIKIIKWIPAPHNLIVFSVPIDACTEELPLCFTLLIELLQFESEKVQDEIEPDAVSGDQIRIVKGTSKKDAETCDNSHSFLLDTQNVEHGKAEIRETGNKHFPKKKRKLDNPLSNKLMQKVIRSAIRSNGDKLKGLVNDKKWRVTFETNENRKNFGFGSVELGKYFGETLDCELVDQSEDEKLNSHVDMKNFELELVVFCSEGCRGRWETYGGGDLDGNLYNSVDTNTDIQRRKYLRFEHDRDIWAVGWRYRREIVEARLNKPAEKNVDSDSAVEKMPSRMNPGIAGSVCNYILHRYFFENNTATRTLKFLDPMCGVGTFCYVGTEAFKRGTQSRHKMIFHGCECDGNSIAIARDNLNCTGAGFNDNKVFAIPLFDREDFLRHKASHISAEKVQNQNSEHVVTFTQADTLDLLVQAPGSESQSENTHSFQESSFDCILVDPPWGHRHGKYSQIMKFFHKWMKVWAKLLKKDGLLGIVTIRTKQVLHDYETHFKGKDLELLERKRFMNKGIDQCELFVFRKT